MTFSLDWKHGWEIQAESTVEIISTNLGGAFPIAFKYKRKFENYWYVYQCTPDGVILDRSDRLRNKPLPVKDKTVWVNCYSCKSLPSGVKSGGNYNSKQEAEEHAKGGKNYLGAFACTVEIPVGS